MPQKPINIEIIKNLPDSAVISLKQAAIISGLSDDTLLRLHRAGEGPPRVQLSARRRGYQYGQLKAWLQMRTADKAQKRSSLKGLGHISVRAILAKRKGPPA
jgi:predicted DNA-binding transcriptional regulator AlpA